MYTYTAFVRCRVVLVSQMCVRLFDKIHFQHSIVDRVLINISFTFLNVQDHIYIRVLLLKSTFKCWNLRPGEVCLGWSGMVTKFLVR